MTFDANTVMAAMFAMKDFAEKHDCGEPCEIMLADDPAPGDAYGIACRWPNGLRHGIKVWDEANAIEIERRLREWACP